MDSTKKRCAYSTCGEPVHFSTTYIRGAVFSYIRYKVVSKILCILCMLLAVLYANCTNCCCWVPVDFANSKDSARIGNVLRVLYSRVCILGRIRVVCILQYTAGTSY